MKRKKDAVLNMKASYVADAPGHIIAEILPRVVQDAVSCRLMLVFYCWVSMHDKGRGGHII
jgi:hypothetical protein